MKRIIIPVICLLSLFLSCTNRQKTESQEILTTDLQNTENVTEKAGTTIADPISLATAQVSRSTLNGIIITPPQKHATITLTMSGIVKKISFLPGNYIRKGAVIVILENTEFIDLQQSFLEAHAQVEFLEAEYQRQKRLSEQEASSKKRFQESKAEYLSMKSRLEAASAQLNILGIQSETILEQGIIPYLEVKSPLNGYITVMDINLGKYINPGEPICEVVDKDEPLLSLTAYEKDLKDLSVGTRITFRTNGKSDEIFQAEVISVGQAIDRVNRSLEVWARITDPNPFFRPGMYISAQLENN